MLNVPQPAGVPSYAKSEILRGTRSRQARPSRALSRRFSSGLGAQSRKRSSESLDVNEDAIKNELGLISNAGTILRAKLIEQFHLVQRIGGAAATYMMTQRTVDEAVDNIDDIMVVNPNGIIKLPSLKMRRKQRFLVDNLYRHRNRTVVKHRISKATPLYEWAHWILSSVHYERLMKVVILLSLICNNLFLEDLLEAENRPITAMMEEAHPGVGGEIYKAVLQIVEHVTTGILLLDVLVKWLHAFNSSYWLDLANIADLMVILLTTPIAPNLYIVIRYTFADKENRSYAKYAVELSTFSKYSRMFRLLLALRFAFSFEGTRILITLLRKTLRRLLKATYLFLLAMVSFGAFAIIAFDEQTSEVTWFPYDMQLHMGALVFTFRNFTGDRWYTWYREFSSRTVVNKAVVLVYIITWIFVSEFLLGNLFVGLLTLNFQEIRNKLEQQMMQLEMLKRASVRLADLNTELQWQGKGLPDSLASQHVQSEVDIAALLKDLGLPSESKLLMTSTSDHHLHRYGLVVQTTLRLHKSVSLPSIDAKSMAQLHIINMHKAMQSGMLTGGSTRNLKASKLVLKMGGSQTSTSGLKPPDEHQKSDRHLQVFPPNEHLSHRQRSNSASAHNMLSPTAGHRQRAAQLYQLKVRRPSIYYPTNEHFTQTRSRQSLSTDADFHDANKHEQQKPELETGTSSSSQEDSSFNVRVVRGPIIPAIRLEPSHSVANTHTSLSQQEPTVSSNLFMAYQRKVHSHLSMCGIEASKESQFQASTANFKGGLSNSNVFPEQYWYPYTNAIDANSIRCLQEIIQKTRIHNVNRKVDQQIEQAQRWNQNLVQNCDIFSNMDTAITYPEDTLLSYLLVLGDLIENMYERSKMFKLLNQSLLGLFENKMELTLSSGYRAVPEHYLAERAKPKASLKLARSRYLKKSPTRTLSDIVQLALSNRHILTHRSSSLERKGLTSKLVIPTRRASKAQSQSPLGNRGSTINDTLRVSQKRSLRTHWS